MVALNGRIHQISEPLRTPASDVFSLLSSHPQLSGWADWVELVGSVLVLAADSVRSVCPRRHCVSSLLWRGGVKGTSRWGADAGWFANGL